MTELERQTVLISGSTGFIGSALRPVLDSLGYHVVSLVRTAPSDDRPHIFWDPAVGALDETQLSRVAPEIVIHLAGESVSGWPWTKAKKQRIWSSRVAGTTLLAEALAELDVKPSVFLSASGSGFYGDCGDEDVYESHGKGTGFLADVCETWESSTSEAEKAGIRTVHLRTGLVLSKDGGLLKQLLPLFRLGLGGKAGKGTNYYPWITLSDWIQAVLFLIESDISGPVNMGSPNPVKSRELSRALAKKLRRPHLLHQPQALLHAAGGEMARELILSGRKMLPGKLLEAGFTFEHPQLDDALTFVLAK